MDKERFFKAAVPIRAMLKFLTSHLVSGTAIACECGVVWTAHLVEYGLCTGTVGVRRFSDSNARNPTFARDVRPWGGTKVDVV